MATTVDLIRHGEPVGGHRYRGQTDDPLSDRGWRQMRTAISAGVPWDGVVSSPLSRCLAFAEALCEQHGLPLERDPRFMEIGFGAWEGKTADEISRQDPEALGRFYRDPVSHRPEGAESLEAFQQRVAGAWHDMLRRHGGKHLLLVAHAGTIRMVLKETLDLPLARLFHIHVANAGITRIRVDGTGHEAFPQLISHGTGVAV